MRRPVRFLHAADVHLDKLDGGRPQRAFRAVIDEAIRLDVDLVLVAGDLFDHARVDPAIVEWAAGEIERASRPVVLISGNHDALHDSSVLHRLGAHEPDNLVLLDEPAGRAVDFAELDLRIWGRALVDHDPAFLPLAGAPARDGDRWLVIAAHGLVVSAHDRMRSSPITPAELAALDCDYAALGHVHDFTVVQESPPAVYPGATHSSRSGQAGCADVRLVPGDGAAVAWLPLDIS